MVRTLKQGCTGPGLDIGDFILLGLPTPATHTDLLGRVESNGCLNGPENPGLPVKGKLHQLPVGSPLIILGPAWAFKSLLQSWVLVTCIIR